MKVILESEIQELEEKIANRKKKIAKFSNFIANIAQERGEVIKRDVGNSNIHAIRELKDFGGFDFRSSTGETMFGGNTFTACFAGKKVFSVRFMSFFLMDDWQPDFNECEVYNFDSDEIWQKAFEKVISLKDDFIRQIDRRRLNLREEECCQIELSEKMGLLDREAARLKL